MRFFYLLLYLWIIRKQLTFCKKEKKKQERINRRKKRIEIMLPECIYIGTPYRMTHNIT